MKHIVLKITACLFAVALWFYVISLKNFQMEIEVPVVLAKLPESLAIASKPPQTLLIMVEGRPIDLIRMKSQKEKAASIIIDLHDAELGTHRVHVTSKNYLSPAFPSIRYVDTEERLGFIDLDIDTRIVRSVPIKSNVTFTPAPGYLITSEPKISPEGLNISGARNALMRIIEVNTDTIKFDTLKKAGTYTISLQFDQLPAYVDPNDSTIEISVDVQKIANKVYNNIPVHLIGLYNKSEYSLAPNEVTVEITGGEQVLSSVKNENIDLFVEINRFTIEDVDSLPPTVNLKLAPEINRDMSIKGVQIKPDKVHLQKRVQPVQQVEYVDPNTPPKVFTMDDVEEEESEH